MKNKIILTGKHGRPSTKLAWASFGENISKLVQRRMLNNGKFYYRIFTDKKQLLLDIENNKRVLYQERTSNTLNNVFDGSDSIIVRWGTRENITTNDKSIVYNKSNAIQNATDKKLSRELFIKNNVSCPVLVIPQNFQEEYLPIIARPFEHSKGKNFIVLKTKNEFLNHYDNNKYYYSNFINKDREFRVHVGHNKVLALMEKNKPNNGNIAWNRAINDEDPFTYVNWDKINQENLKIVLDEAISAVNALGLDMGGVDVMYKDGKAYVLEVNTAPTLNSSPYVAKRWSMYWNWLFNSEKRREHWKIDEFKKGSSLIWKNYQLKDELNGNEDE